MLKTRSFQSVWLTDVVEWVAKVVLWGATEDALQPG